MKTSPIALPESRSGITLIEVLIAIGILAIGLSSVAAILPAAKSQATRAVVFDRASSLAANVLDDAATFGMLRDGTLSSPFTPGSLRIIDPAVPGNYSFGSKWGIRTGGVFSNNAHATSAPSAYHRLFTESRDDLVVGPPLLADGPDGLPTNAFADGTRAYEGRFSAMIALLPETSPKMGLMSVVVFHNRDVSAPYIDGKLDGASLSVLPANIPPGRTFAELVRPGVVIVQGTTFHQITSAAIQPGGSVAFVSVVPPAANGAIYLLPDSVGLAQRPFTPEINGPFLQ